MYYKIADVVLKSEVELPSFLSFTCDAAEADIILDVVEREPEEGEEISSGHVQYRKVKDGWFFHYDTDEDSGILISSDYSRLSLNHISLPMEGLGEWFVRVAIECFLIRRGFVSLHAACIDLDGQAIAFTGVSGMGKSTRANAWCDAFGAEFISGDRPLIHVKSGMVYGVPWDGKEQCFRNVRSPLKTIYEVRRSTAAYVRKLSNSQKRKLLMRQCFIPMWDSETALVQMMNISCMSKQLEIVRIFSGPTEADARELRKVIDQKSYLEEQRDMKVKSGFVLRNIVDEYFVIPLGETVEKFQGTVVLNEVSAFVWKKLESPTSRDDVLNAILDEFEIDEVTAARDLDALLEKLRGFELIEED